MKPLLRMGWLVAWLTLAPPAVRAAVIGPLGLDQNAVPWNLQSERGVPISAEAGVPAGSDGRMSLVNESYQSYNPPTANQFTGLNWCGATPGLSQSNWQAAAASPYLTGTNSFSGMVAQQMRLPVGLSNNAVAIVLRRARVGGPYLGRETSFLYGQLVSVPATDESGTVLTNVAASAYWLPEPYTADNHGSDPYYWSPNARAVYAVQPGPILITWRKATPYTSASVPASYVNALGPASFETNGGNIYLLYTVRYLVSGVPVKTPRKMYWTEGFYGNTGTLVPLSGKVSAVRIVYNENFPEFVATNDIVAASVPEVVLPGLTDRTFWFDSQNSVFHARNREGRVFLELLGDNRSDGLTREQLGYELVEVLREPTPSDVTVELGERLVPPAPSTLADLAPLAPTEVAALAFVFRHNGPGADQDPRGVEYYAIQETHSLNDYRMHWLEQGLQGIRWSKAYARYSMIWPTDPSHYAHYVRSAAASDAEARATGIAISTQLAPYIQYQDALDAPRAKLSPEGVFYTRLDAAQPAHRTLLRFISGNNIAFERVFSWLDTGLKSPETFQASAIVNSLAAWNAGTHSFDWPDPMAAPRVVNETRAVGERILAPAGEIGSAAHYLAGHINAALGDSYHPGDYVDPLTSGFTAANAGAIFPVNAIPGANRLEVWWFRADSATAGPNIGNQQLGFTNVYWPAVIGRYTIEWPADTREIVLASKLGSGTLDPYESTGTIYYQNDRTLPGYNPNEEHAIMAGGMAYATRDDLNLTNVGASYSSAPFVLVDYSSNGVPCMSVFKVLREKPEAGYVFDYPISAGMLLQPPPPLAFLAAPVETVGGLVTNYNTEPGNTVGNVTVFNADESAGADYSHYSRFTYRDRKQQFWVYRGPHAGLPPLCAGSYQPGDGTFSPLTNATAVAGAAFAFTVHASRQTEFLELRAAGLPNWLTLSGFTLSGTPGTNAVGVSSNIQLIVEDLQDHATVTNVLGLAVAGPGGAVATQRPLSVVCVNPYTGSVLTFTNRAPFLALSPNKANSFTMRYYYKTEPSFAWPALGSSAPAAGSIVPYLRAMKDGAYVGDGAAKTDSALDIVYRPFWPERDPADPAKPIATMPYGYTLTGPVSSPAILPGIRDWKTGRVLYQQSVATIWQVTTNTIFPGTNGQSHAMIVTNLAYLADTNLVSAANSNYWTMARAYDWQLQTVVLTNVDPTRASVVLHDATRQKTADLAASGLTGLPASVVSEYYQGKYYFPKLPPHLGHRLYYDPNLGTKGSLVLKGQYVAETVGESYVLLNVLRGSDLAAALGLCPDADTTHYSAWTNAITQLATRLETFVASTNVPGTFVVDDSLTVTNDVGSLAEIVSDNVAKDSYALSATGPGGGYVVLVESGGDAFTQAGDPVALHVLRVGGGLFTGTLKVLAAENPLSELVTFQHTPDLAGRFDEFEYQWKIAAPADGVPPDSDDEMSRYLALVSGPDLPRYVLGGAGVQALGDNYVTLRYRPLNPNHPLYKASEPYVWSSWTTPQLAEGWIKRVLAGINPFNQRVKELFNNAVNTDVSLLTQAGRRWEGDVALNYSTINNYGLIEIYETVLRRGRMLSIESGYNYGPANDALLLAAGYLSDLYMALGNEAWADAANPTIGIGTADRTYGDIATALFAFKGQEPSLLEEELALLRGRDDFLQPGCQVPPVYNRLFWNYTRGIDAGEVIYALNYNVQPAPANTTAVIGAADAAHMYPQGHGDAYGHYLTALGGYYSLLVNSCFDWVPRTEAVLVLGQAVQVDYLDERKFAIAAAAVARAGRQIFDLTWRRDYQPVRTAGWGAFGTVHTNPRQSYTAAGATTNTASFWGLDHWATRTGQGGYLDWVVGNAILPDVDNNSNHTGIQKVDRTTVPELQELATLATGLQTALDNAEGGLTPLGLAQDALVFDVNPTAVVGADGATHFEQVYQRARLALDNAVAAFDDAKGVTALMRSEEDSLTALRASVASQELAYQNALIELYGTPYADDLGAGQTYSQDYTGPDLLHYNYVDLPESDFNGLLNPQQAQTNRIDLQSFPADWASRFYDNLNWIVFSDSPDYTNSASTSVSLEFVWDSHGFFGKPTTWTGRRATPGRVQQRISELIAAHDRVGQALSDAQGAKDSLDKAIRSFNADVSTHYVNTGLAIALGAADEALGYFKTGSEISSMIIENCADDTDRLVNTIANAAPTIIIAGMACGTDALRAASRAPVIAVESSMEVINWINVAQKGIILMAENLNATLHRWTELGMAENQWLMDLRNNVQAVSQGLGTVQESLTIINARLREFDDATRAYRAAVAEGDRILAERTTYRARVAQLIQGYRTRDVAFRLFRNEKLERYKTLFDLAARYAFLAANAYDYETGLLDTDAGRAFVARIVNARALGVVRNGEPQYAGSDTGDPGLSSALAEMKADWEVLRGRLGFNNPDAYGTTVSLRTELLRILPGTEGDANWKDAIQSARVSDLLADSDVRRYCLQIDNGSGLAVPGLVLSFPTVIASGCNLFGQPLAAGDHAYSESAFATKIFAAGVALLGYRGMDNPTTGSASGGTSPSDPSSWFLDPLALSATPYVYLIPVGVDSMRSPPLGDTSDIRTWTVADVAIPMPFNIGASGFSTQPLWQSSDSLTEPLFALRKHQAFRPVSDPSVFSVNLYGDTGSLRRSQFTNNRLVGRSVWNSRWKLVIPARTLLNDPKEGLDRFVQTVTDIKLHWVTYSYSGN